MRLKQGFILFAILATLLCAGCQGTTTPPPSTQPSSSPSEPPISFFLEVTEPQDEAVVDTSPIRVSGSTSPGTTVSVSGTLIDVNAHGNFAATIELEEGPNVIEVIATDYEGNEDYRILTVIYAPQD